MADRDEPLYTVAEAAAWLKISKASLYALTAARTVPFTRPAGTKHIRFTQEHLDEIVAAGYQPVISPPSPLRAIATRAGLVGTHPPAGPSTPTPPSGPKVPSTLKPLRRVG